MLFEGLKKRKKEGKWFFAFWGCIGARNLPALWHRLRRAGVFAAPPEVSAIAATSGYCLATLRVEKAQRKRTRKMGTVHGKYAVITPLRKEKGVQF
jgi:hypothetical protein